MKKLIALATLATFLGVGTAWAAPDEADAKAKVVKKADLKGKVVKKADLKGKADLKIDPKGKCCPCEKMKRAPRKGGDILRDLIKKGKVKPMSKKERELRKQRRLEAEKDLDKLLK